MSKFGNGCQNSKCTNPDCKDIFCGIKRHVPIYPIVNSPHKEVHALFYYYLIAHQQLEQAREGAIVYEGDPDPVYDFVQLAKNIANLYEVPIEHMCNCWDEIDNICVAFGLPIMPDNPKYRHNSKIIIN